MGRSRVLSFMSQFSGAHRDSRTPTPTSSPSTDSHPPLHKADLHDSLHPRHNHAAHEFAPAPAPSTPAPSSPVRASARDYAPPPASVGDSPSASPAGRNRSSSRPLSMVQAYQPPLMDVNEDTIPELQPIFTLLNSHANKLYQEGYFLKLDDQNTQGRPNPDRTWTECFAQLVGTVLSLWDANELDAAGEDGEVLPKFINLTDASIKMIESLPTRSNNEEELRNILSISTAGRNRYLLHFNSHHSLIQWTAGIRLAMFEHSTLQEAYTGALIAGKGKTLNNINLIMDRTRFKTEEWVRVRFGAGVPWRRCWCVISPPDEKEYQKLQKELKKRSPYDRSQVPILKGDIKFYDTRKEGKKQKKAQPIASITDAYSAYAIYPQAKSLIDMSTLVKIEGNITIHSDPPSSTEGFVFVMPEVHPAVTGFEMLLRFLFPTWDTFGLYGRPGRLVASVLDPRSLMFAMPKHKRYGYLEILDVSGLILTEGSSSWQEREWRKRLKDLTGRRMNAVEDGSTAQGRSSSRNSKRLSFGPLQSVNPRPRVNFADDTASDRSSRSVAITQPGARTDSAPPAADRERAPPALGVQSRHMRNVSDTQLMSGPGFDSLPGPQTVLPSAMRGGSQAKNYVNDLASTPERVSSEDERPYRSTQIRDLENMARMQTPEPVSLPPAFAHTPSSKPASRPYHSPEMRRANSRLSSTTLSQLAKAGGISFDSHPEETTSSRPSFDGSAGSSSGTDPRGPAVIPAYANPVGMAGSANGSGEALNPTPPRSSPGLPPPQSTAGRRRSKSPLGQSYAPRDEYGPPQPPPHADPSSTGPPSDAGPRMPPPNARNFNAPFDQHAGVPAPPGAAPSSYQPYQVGGASVGPRSTPPPDKDLPPLRTSGSINRKPLPQRTTSLQRRVEDAPPQSPSSAGSFSRAFDESALARVHPPEGGRTPPDPEASIVRQDTQKSGTSSHYDDNSSTTSPDYASTRQSTDTQGSEERPRAGVLKTVGDAFAAQHSAANPHVSSDYNIPEINFGPTLNYAAQGVPRNKTPTPLSGPGGSASAAPGRITPTSAARPGNAHSRQDSDDTIRRSVAWQPGSVTVGSQFVAGAVVSAEQFVQQRAAAATTPLYAHQRQPSGNTLAGIRAGTPTPPLKRTGSHDYLSQAGGHSRSGSADLLQQGRPASQMGFHSGGTGDMSSHLSAREQEHVARVTGSPLINVGPNNNRVTPPTSGLVGAIEAREREKAQIKQGYSSQAVQHAINQRQAIQAQQAQQAAQVAYAQQQQQQQQSFQPGYPGQMYGSPQMAMMNAGTPSPPIYGAPLVGGRQGISPGPGQGQPPQQRTFPVQQQQSYAPPQNWVSPAAQVYAQGGGWSRPNMAVRQGPPQQGQQPGMAMGIPPQGQQGFPPAPQGQYSPGAGQRPGSQFQGQAF